MSHKHKQTFGLAEFFEHPKLEHPITKSASKQQKVELEADSALNTPGRPLFFELLLGPGDTVNHLPDPASSST